MVNTRAKGRRSEMKAKAILEAAGYDVIVVKPARKFDTENDFFGLWDAIAVNSVGFRCVQVKTNKKPTKEYTEGLSRWVCPPNCTKELWIFRDREPIPLIFVL